MLILACDDFNKKPQPNQVPSTENKSIDEMKKTHRQIDSMKFLNKKKSKPRDTLKPGIAKLEFSEE